MATQRPKRSEITEINLNDDEAEVAPLAPNGPSSSAGASRRQQGNSVFGDIVTKFMCVVFVVVASLGLHEVRFWHVLLYSSRANRPLVNLGIFFCTAVVLLGSYLEYYRAIYLGETLEYKKAQSTTHAILASMVLAGISFSIGLWPVWHWMTVPILFMWFWGLIVPLVVLLPPTAQKVVFAGVYIYFMHSYLSTFML
ncbi:hypothetical protein DYB28_002467 [Aphanomyces astaci]|uniref:Transmembrane protein n=1 Tax=Aphanomyces astaci TaxID=112090 RepID=A0A397BQ21_APHAT|nr:hypothetical protein DYB36_007416 [Aphanomyces astaci]RHY23874.1 hypothetical protein DYB25_000883 [Aphanomyces astaci]RHY41050.1 hypothetical protein DYB38_000959 [Aphanomyces astaci]RHY46638.1 hypothetical protein DYB30_001252 [Aphanomyces astaci]RHY67826.1 hypothetical protein DYB34_000201 [Aphanomyces astaci]